MIMLSLQLAFGMVVLFGSAEVLIRGAVSLAKAFHVPPLVIGMTIIAIGTSAPELMVTVKAALAGAPGLAIGNVIGSNIANVLLVLGASCMLSPIDGPVTAHRRDGIVLVLGTGVFVLLCLRGGLDVVSGAILLVVFTGFLVSAYRVEKKDDAALAEHIMEVEEVRPLALGTPMVSLVVLVSLAGVVWGADVMVVAAVGIAEAYGVPEEIIGLTVVAFGTSLPELAASLVAAYRGHSDIAVGNIVGSNLFNVLAIPGVGAMVATLPVVDRLLQVDLWVMLAATAILLPILAGRWHPGRAAGVVMAALYVAYLAFNAVDAGLIGAG